MKGIEQGFAIMRRKARQEMPDPLCGPGREIDHPRARCYLGCRGRHAFILRAVDRLVVFNLVADVGQHGGAELCASVVHSIDRPSTRDVKRLLRENRPRIGLFDHLMNSDAREALIVIINPEKGRSAPILGQKRWMDIDGAKRGYGINLWAQHPAVCSNTDNIRAASLKHSQNRRILA